jgi:hypothetical protein
MAKEAKVEQKETKVFTYEVKMIVSIFDTDEKSAQDKLDREGGYVSKRDVVLLDAQPIIK